MRINADLNRFHAQSAKPLCFLGANHDTIGLEFDAEGAQSRVLQDLEKIPAHQDLAATEGEIEDTGIGHLIEKVLDFRCGHLAVIVVVKVAMNASFVAAISQIQLDAERD